MSVLSIDQHNFQNLVLQAEGPVMVDFWAEWCGPCRMLSPIVEQIAEEHPEVTVAKVNVDENPQLVQQFQIMGIPALLLFKEGKQIAHSVGFQTKTALESLLK